MSDFLGDIMTAKNAQANKRNKVINDITGFFKERIANPQFEEALKKAIIDNIKDNENTTDFFIEFWDGHSGCSNTNFYMSGCGTWKSDSIISYGWYYKGMRIYDVRYEVALKLKDMFETELRRLGLHYRFIDKTHEYRFDYPKFHFEVTV